MSKPGKRTRYRKTCDSAAPPELRGNLEVTRIYLLALFRSLDRLSLAQDLPPRLRLLFELDATLAEGLWVLDQPLGRFNMAAMTQDCLGTIEAVLQTIPAFLDTLPLGARIRLAEMISVVRQELTSADAYNQIPGHDPSAG